MFVRPWNKESRQILMQLSHNNGKAFTINSRLSIEFGRKYPDLFDTGLLDVAGTRYSKRPDKTFFVTPPDVMVIPKSGGHGINFHFRRYKIL